MDIWLVIGVYHTTICARVCLQSIVQKIYIDVAPTTKMLILWTSICHKCRYFGACVWIYRKEVVKTVNKTYLDTLIKRLIVIDAVIRQKHRK